MATEYIKKEDALNAFRRAYMVPLESKAKDIYVQQIENTYRKIENIQAVDVVPRELYELTLRDVVTLSVERKRGKWISMMGHSICNACGYKASPILTNFCPNCGADMRGEP